MHLLLQYSASQSKVLWSAGRDLSCPRITVIPRLISDSLCHRLKPAISCMTEAAVAQGGSIQFAVGNELDMQNKYTCSH